MSALEGDMDARVATANASPRGVTAGLASAAALRAFGSAAAVALAPRVIADAGVAGLSVAFTTVLLTAIVLTLAWHRSQPSLPGTGPATHPG
jgi:anti-sigma factor RsiW